LKQPLHDRIGAGGAPGGKDGFLNKNQTTPYSISACALGNFHCDVMYCKETYCKQEYYIKKYSHHLKENGWVA